ncbi:MAG: hypothetical protein JNM14_00930 [Ferruginibacter sp.]|nr:hypothetical protein [Ferruginibacter sp.]
MKKIIYSVFALAFLFAACKGKSAASGDQTSPKGVANMIFDAAKSGDYSQLKNLCEASLASDGDSRRVCEVADADDKTKSSFKEYFSTGKVVGEPTIEGEEASVNITFGPDGTKEETLKMQKKDGKWYLYSF